MDFDMIVIGAGPGGYSCALKASQYGKKVALIERANLGGTCLNVGCIPTKTLLHLADQGRKDIESMHWDKNIVVEGQQKGIRLLLESAGVTLIEGQAQIDAQNHVHVNGEVYQAETIVVASGSAPHVPPIPGADLPGVITSDALLRGEVPEIGRLAIVGGGVIGVEIASLYTQLDTEVCIIEALPSLLANMDTEIGRTLQMQFKKSGVAVATDAKVQRIEKNEGGSLTVYYLAKDKEEHYDADVVLIATGRKAAIDGLFTDDATPELERGTIKINEETFETSRPGLYAIGDARGNIQLAHHATAQAKALCELLYEGRIKTNLSSIPACVYTQPEIASVGLTEKEAKALGYTPLVGKVNMNANAKSVVDAIGHRSFIKLIFDDATHQLLGGQMMCGRASDLIAIVSVALAGRVTAEDLAEQIYSHPTYAEGIGEAAEAALGTALMVVQKRGR